MTNDHWVVWDLFPKISKRICSGVHRFAWNPDLKLRWSGMIWHDDSSTHWILDLGPSISQNLICFCLHLVPVVSITKTSKLPLANTKASKTLKKKKERNHQICQTPKSHPNNKKSKKNTWYSPLSWDPSTSKTLHPWNGPWLPPRRLFPRPQPKNRCPGPIKVTQSFRHDRNY